jgi:hypothetical protein
MARFDRTSMGGIESRLKETPWSQIFGARTQDQTRRRLCLENLAKTYWKPIYCYLIRKNFSNEDAKDLTQSFFNTFFLEGKLLRAADRKLGCFRQLLCTALKRYISNIKRDDNRKIRKPNGILLSLSSAKLDNSDPLSSEATPEQAYEYAWITSLLDQTLLETKHQCFEVEQQVHWQVFYKKVLAPILEDAKDISMQEISNMYGLEDANQANSRIVTVKRRFGRNLKRRLRELTGSDSGAESEFEEIMRFLSERSARS